MHHNLKMALVGLTTAFSGVKLQQLHALPEREGACQYVTVHE